MTITLNEAGAGESWSAAGADFRILADGSAVDGRWGLVECTLAPGWVGPPQHVHREHDESFFILTGTVKFTSGRADMLATPGALVTAPIGDPHTFANADAEAPASFLCTVTPERYIGYLKELAALRPGPDGRLDPADVLAVMSRYGTEPYPATTGRA
ncbi:MAG: cupin [Modestobacter sp.]|jgi:mannose-6-phosphate isomerase-like protein (cupin superfamily)|nr:cupin [Modestobacter sp.]